MCEPAISAATSSFDMFYNPSSLYTEGRNVNKAINDVRSIISKKIYCNPTELYFTASGSESNNWALQSIARLGKQYGKTHIVSTNIEHPSVLKTLFALSNEGFEISLVTPDSNGIVSAEQIGNCITDKTSLVSVMTVNNEIGSIQPITEIGLVCKAKGVLFHTDAVQAIGKVPVDVVKQNIDLMSMSGRKFGAGSGIGCLYCKSTVKIPSLIYGGSQEKGKRAGTENTTGILAFGAAFEDAYEHIEKKSSEIFLTKEKLANKFSQIPGSRINAWTIESVPNILSVSFSGISGESLSIMLASDGILTSTASACSLSDRRTSHVLTAIGVPDEFINGTVRFSFGNNLTESDIDYIYDRVKTNVETLRRIESWQKKSST